MSEVPDLEGVDFYGGRELVDSTHVETVASGPNRGYQYIAKFPIRLHRGYRVNNYLTQQNPILDIQVKTRMYNLWNALKALKQGDPAVLYNGVS